jgi:lysophospholipase L1-like esterase
VAFGVGASSDASCLSSQLAMITDQPWFNFSGRASNLMQDVLTYLLFSAPIDRNIVLMSGINDLLFALTFESAFKQFPTFWGDDMFSELNKLDAPDMFGNTAELSVEQRYLRALQGIDRALLLLARHARSEQTRILFALQPLLAWTDKPSHAKEKSICNEWDAVQSGFRATHKPEIILPWKERFSEDVGSICLRHEIGFVDLNLDSAWQTEEQLFADRIHLTDQGQRVAAQLISNRLSELRR